MLACPGSIITIKKMLWVSLGSATWTTISVTTKQEMQPTIMMIEPSWMWNRPNEYQWSSNFLSITKKKDATIIHNPSACNTPKKTCIEGLPGPPAAEERNPANVQTTSSQKNCNRTKMRPRMKKCRKILTSGQPLSARDLTKKTIPTPIKKLKPIILQREEETNVDFFQKKIIVFFFTTYRNVCYKPSDKEKSWIERSIC